LAVVIWMTWPLARFANTHIAGVTASSDAFYSMWALAWQTHALATDPARYFDANIYYPARHALVYGPTGTGALPLFGPVFVVTHNLQLATNVLFIAGSALTAWTICLVATRWTRSVAAGVVAGSTYLAAPWVLYEWVPRAPHFAMLMWIPLIIDRAARPLSRVRDALVLSVMVALQAAVEIVYVGPAIFAPLALIALVRVFRRDTRASGLRLGLAIVGALVALSPLLAAHVAVRRANPELALQTPWRLETPTPPEWAPVIPWSLFGWWKRVGNGGDPPPPMAVPPLAFGLIGCGVLSRALRHPRRRDRKLVREWRHAALWTVAGAALALPGEGSLFGTHLWLPHTWLCEFVPIACVVRVPMRLGVVGLVGLSLLAGLAFAELVMRTANQRWAAHAWRRAAWWGLASVIALAILEQPRAGVGYPPGFVPPRPPRPYPLHPAPTETPYAAILHEGHGPLLEIGAAAFVPPIRRPLPESLAMIRSIAHWRPLLNGYSSYWPEQYPRSMALAARLPEEVDALAMLQKELGVDLILVWPNELPPGKREAWTVLARAHGNDALVLVGAGQHDALLFRVRDTSPDATQAPGSSTRE
jgi:hypothetical protein